MSNIEYIPEYCPHCDQSTTYLISVDRGTAEIVKKLARFIGKKGVNYVHPRKEMEGICMSSNEVGNLSRARFHGLIARVPENRGNYSITNKGFSFLRGEPISKYAIISKSKKMQIGYWQAEKEQVDIKSFNTSDDWWEGINYTISSGRVVVPTATRQTSLL